MLLQVFYGTKTFFVVSNNVTVIFLVNITITNQHFLTNVNQITTHILSLLLKSSVQPHKPYSAHRTRVRAAYVFLYAVICVPIRKYE